MSGGLGPTDLARLVEVAATAARLGGDVVAGHFGQLTAGVHSKAPGDYVSEVDLQSEQTIREALERDAPGIPFFGEESGGTKGDLWWVVDPLDGTANFLHGFPVVGVSVGLVEAGRPVVGAVHAPLLGGETFTAVRGGGAFREGRPIASYVRPAATAASGSMKFRPSTNSDPRIAPATPARSRSRNSGHSVTSTIASAPSTASSALDANATPLISLRASSSATGS